MTFVLTHQPCANCKSSDGLSYNEDGSSLCFVCNEYTRPPEDEEVILPTKKDKTVNEAYLSISPKVTQSPSLSAASVEPLLRSTVLFVMATTTTSPTTQPKAMSLPPR